MSLSQAGKEVTLTIACSNGRLAGSRKGNLARIMRPDLNAIASRTDLTEEDLQVVLQERELCLAQGDELGYANCLLTLSHVVKWVRSDNGETPFGRGHTLALEALSIMRRLQDSKGTIRALVQAAPMSSPTESQAMLEEALSIARALGDAREIARVLNRLAAKVGLSDRPLAIKLNREALEIFEQIDHVLGQATCLFGLAIQEKDDLVKFDCASRCAELYRSANRSSDAARATSMALMYWPDGGDLAEKRALAERGLKDAQDSGNTSLEGNYYGRLAEISAEQGNYEESDQFRRWEKEIEESDGLTVQERQRNELEFTEAMATIAKAQGHKEAAAMFKDRAKELKNSKSAK